MTRLRARVAKAIEDHPLIASLLYDLDLMPEQVKRGDKRREGYMDAVVAHMLAALAPVQSNVAPQAAITLAPSAIPEPYPADGVSGEPAVSTPVSGEGKP